MLDTRAKIEEKLSDLFYDGFDSGVDHMIDEIVKLGIMNERMGEMIKMAAHSHDIIRLETDPEFRDLVVSEKYHEIVGMLLEGITYGGFVTMDEETELKPAEEEKDEKGESERTAV